MVSYETCRLNWLYGTEARIRGCRDEALDEIANALADCIGLDEDSTYGVDEEWWEDVLVRRSYTADFETTTDLDVVSRVGRRQRQRCIRDSIERGTAMEWFVNGSRERAKCSVYLHNQAFDGTFIMDWLEG